MRVLVLPPTLMNCISITPWPCSAPGPEPGHLGDTGAFLPPLPHAQNLSGGL